MALVDPRDMLNNFCFHVYAQKSLFVGENGNDFILTSSVVTLSFLFNLAQGLPCYIFFLLVCDLYNNIQRTNR